MRPRSRGPTPDNAMASPGRLLECIFCFYFAAHIPVTLAIDLQALLPRWMFPAALQGLVKWYATQFRDPMIMDPPTWFSTFVLCEALLQLPFFPVAAYAFYKGSCPWVRTPAIVYSTHVATTVIPILGHVLFNDFSKSTYPGPNTLPERLSLLAIYSPYLLIPVMILLTMLYSQRYNSFSGKKRQ